MKYVLLLEDEELVMEITAEILENLGYTPVLAENGREALDKTQKLYDEGKSLHLSILDLNVPGGLSGKDTFLELRKIDPRLRGILTTGHNPSKTENEFLEMGFSKVLNKPFRIQELAALLKKMDKDI